MDQEVVPGLPVPCASSAPPAAARCPSSPPRRCGRCRRPRGKRRPSRRRTGRPCPCGGAAGRETEGSGREKGLKVQQNLRNSGKFKLAVTSSAVEQLATHLSQTVPPFTSLHQLYVTVQVSCVKSMTTDICRYRSWKRVGPNKKSKAQSGETPAAWLGPAGPQTEEDRASCSDTGWTWSTSGSEGTPPKNQADQDSFHRHVSSVPTTTLDFKIKDLDLGGFLLGCLDRSGPVRREPRGSRSGCPGTLDHHLSSHRERPF